MRDEPRQEFRWINSPRLTGWLCPAVQIGDPADKVIRMLREGGVGVRWPDVPQILWDQLISQSWPCTTDTCGEFIIILSRGHKSPAAWIMGNHWKILF